MSEIRRTPTGISTLDEMIEGGLPSGTCTLVCGGPGAGKTIFSIQFLVNGIKKYNEPGVFITFDEVIDHVRRNMLRFGWNLEELEKQNMLAPIDLSQMLYMTPEEFKEARWKDRPPETSIRHVAFDIRRRVEEIKAKRIVVDSATALMAQELDVGKRRRDIAHLFRVLLETGCTCMVTSETRFATLQREFQIEEYLAQGAIILNTVTKGDRFVRTVQIEKMRGTAPDMQSHPYNIGKNGIEIYTKEIVI